MNKPYDLTAQEWEELAGLRAVQEGFGLEVEEKPAEWLRSYAYGVRFDYENESPGYDGPLYLLKGAGAPEIPPLLFIRVGGALIDLDSWLMSASNDGRVTDRVCALPICDGVSLLFGDDGSMECRNRSCPNYGREV
jgi:hypothetical protein